MSDDRCVSHPSDECVNLEGVQVRGLRPSLGLVHLGALAAEFSGVVLIRPCVPRASSYPDESSGESIWQRFVPSVP